MGSDNQAGGPGGEQQAAAGSDTGSGTGEGSDADEAGADEAGADDAGADDTGTSDSGKDEGADEAKDEPSDRGAPFLDDGPDGEDGSGGEEAAPDLLALVTPPTTTVAEEEVSAGEEGGSVGGSSGAVEPQADEQPISENQFALAASPAPAKQPSSGGERAPTRRSEPAETAPVVEQDAASRSERVRARADRLAATPVAEPAALQGSGHGQAVVEPAATETFGTAPVAPAPAPVPAASISTGPDFAPTQVGAVRGAGAVPAALPAGPRLGGAGPTGTPGPVF
jgi:hypothetical protein